MIEHGAGSIQPPQDPIPLINELHRTDSNATTLVDDELSENGNAVTAIPLPVFDPPWSRQETPNAGPPDSDYGTDTESVCSITSSCIVTKNMQGREFVTISGSQSWHPTDDKFCEVVDLMHAVDNIVLGHKLCTAHLGDDVQNAVDIGTRTGTWAVEFAESHPHIRVTGTDRVYCQPGCVPPNLTFELDDLNNDWTWRRGSCDFFHMRRLAGTIRDWNHLCQQAYYCLRPGGYLESYESSFYFQSVSQRQLSSEITEWNELFAQIGERSQCSFQIVEDGAQRRSMEAAGFCIEQERDLQLPVGNWHLDQNLKVAGMMAQDAYTYDLEGFLTSPTIALGWEPESAIRLAAELRKQLRKGPGLYLCIKNVVGRKPLDSF